MKNILPIISLLLLTSCNTELESLQGGGKEVQFSVAEVDITKAIVEGTTLPSGSAVGISQLYTAGTDAATQSNVINAQYTENSGSLTSTTPIFYDNSDAVATYYAYYPYASESTNYAAIPVNIEDDLLYATATSSSANTSTIPLTFKHALSKLVIQCTNTNDIDGGTYSITIKDQYKTATCNLTDGSFDFSGQTTSDIAITASLDDKASLFIPEPYTNSQTKQQLQIKLYYTIDGVELCATATIENNFDAGSCYTYKIKVNYDNAEFVGGPTITSFDDSNTTSNNNEWVGSIRREITSWDNELFIISDNEFDHTAISSARASLAITNPTAGFTTDNYSHDAFNNVREISITNPLELGFLSFCLNTSRAPFNDYFRELETINITKDIDLSADFSGTFRFKRQISSSFELATTATDNNVYFRNEGNDATFTPLKLNICRNLATFNGGGNTIYGLNIVECLTENSIDCAGFISAKDNLLDSPITLKNTVVRGYVRISQLSQSQAHIGGLIGSAQYVNIESCASYIRVKNTATQSATKSIGGLVGYLNSGSSISNCYHSGTVEDTTAPTVGTLNIGGLIGYATSGTSAKNSFTYSDMIPTENDAANNCYVGAFVGYINNATFTNCYYNSNVNNDNQAATINDCGKQEGSAPVSIEAQDSKEMRLSTFLSLLNENGTSTAWKKGSGWDEHINYGFPLLTFGITE